MKNTQIKRFLNSQGVGLIFCSHHASTSFSKKYSAEYNLKQLIKGTNASLHSISVWGHFDYVGTIYSKSTDEILNLSRNAPGLGPGIVNFKVILGSVLHEDHLFEKQLSKYDLPIKAICSFKCNKNFIQYQLDKDIKRDSVWDFFSEFINICVKNAASTRNITKSNILIQIIAPYSWNDFIILVQSNSIQSIKQYVLSLRRSTFDNAKSGKRHLFFYSDTIIGVPYSVESKTKKQSQKILKNLQEEKLDWNLNVRSRPGHSSQLQAKFEKKATKTIELTSFTYIGGYDLTIRPKKETTLSEFMTWYFTELAPIAEQEASSILKTKTNFYLDFCCGENHESSNDNKKAFNFRDKARNLRKKKNLPIPNHILSALENVSSSFDFLVNQHETIKCEFIIVSNAFSFFLNYFEKWIIPSARELKGHQLWIDLMEYTCNILDEFAHILSERFREGHLCGDIHFEVPSVTYSGSFQKNLQAIENFVMKLMLNAGLQLQNFCYKDLDYETLNQVCCSVRNSESPSNRIYLNNAFIHIPLDSLVFQENWFYIFHETGHILIDDLLTILVNKDKELASKIKDMDLWSKDMLDELFADAFTVKLLFGLDYQKYIELLFDYYIKELNKWNIPSYRVKIRKLLLKSWTLLDKSERLELDDNDYNDILSSIEREERKKDFEEAYSEFKSIVNANDIIMDWFKSLHAIEIGQFERNVRQRLKDFSQISDCAYKVFLKDNSNSKELHVSLKNLRRKIIYELWFDSVVSDYVSYYEDRKVFEI